MQKYWCVVGARDGHCPPEYNIAGKMLMVVPEDAEAYAEKRAREAERFQRELILSELQALVPKFDDCSHLQNAIDRIRSRGQKEAVPPKPLKFDPSDPYSTVEDLVVRVNELSESLRRDRE